MVSPGFPANERQRLAALHSFEILDTQTEKAFDRVTLCTQIETIWSRWQQG